MHQLARLVRLCFILVPEFAAPAVLSAHPAFIIHQRDIHVLSADTIMTLTEIPVKQTAKIQGVLVQVVVEVVEDGQAIVINKMVA